MLLKELFENNRDILNPEWESIEINKIQYDSRKVKKGDLFVAVKGYQTDGHNYLQQVYKHGAAAAVVQEANPQVNLKQIVVMDSRSLMAVLAYNYFKKYLEKIDLIGITGTNGKTTCSYLIQSILQAAGISCGLAGTIEYIIGSKKITAWNTTPEAIDLYDMLAQMQKAGNKACVLEVSSHALALNRVGGLKFKTALFTNLSRDHMDFHKNMDVYFADKSKLFDQLANDGLAVLNDDDVYAKKIKVDRKVLTFGTTKNSIVYANNWVTDVSGTELNVYSPKGDIQIHSVLVGDFNVYNILAAVTAGLSLNIDLTDIKKGIENLKTVPGRLEKYSLKNGAQAIIDYAHTPDALEKALNTVRKITANNLIVVFGCGGDRDKGKRPEMGRVAQNLADIIYVTDDNPRTENSSEIINDILEGMELDNRIKVIPDRKVAIATAIKNSREGDIILVAGKGHETYQIIGSVKRDFNEAKIIREAEKNA